MSVSFCKDLLLLSLDAMIGDSTSPRLKTLNEPFLKCFAIELLLLLFGSNQRGL